MTMKHAAGMQQHDNLHTLLTFVRKNPDFSEQDLKCNGSHAAAGVQMQSEGMESEEPLLKLHLIPPFP